MLQATAAEQLALLVKNLTLPIGGLVIYGEGKSGTSPGDAGKPNPGVTPVATVYNDLLVAMNKLLWNSKLIVQNTGLTAYNTGSSSSAIGFGIYGEGGWVGGGLHTAGGTMINAELGEHVTNRISAGANRSLLDAINAARGPIDLSGMSSMNDNAHIAPNIVPLPIAASRSDVGFNFAEMLSVMRSQGANIEQLKNEVAALRKENGANTIRAAQYIGAKVEKVKETTDKQTDKLVFEERQNHRTASGR